MKFIEKIILFTFFTTSFAINVNAQERKITGNVVDSNGIPLAGANVIEYKTTNGTITDFDGNFTITVSSENPKLQVSYVGFKPKTIKVGTESNYSIQLEFAAQLDEVVVTALGVKREEKALGYSVQKLATDEVAKVKATNFTDNLAGKVSGVFITGSSAGPSASSNINIRGAASLLGNNQPLFVVNGMPITNDLYSFDDGLNGSTTIDFGNAAQNINPDDIESVNVLKGPAASALYGARAADGVILVETKTGENAKGWGVEINNTTTFSSILKMPDFQNEYGFGGGGKYSYFDGTNYIGENEYYEAYGENWGPRMNGQLIKQFNSNGEAVPFTPAPDNVKDFYRMGSSIINNVAINNSTEDSDFRFSYTRLDKEGIMPNTNLKRNTFQVSLGKSMFDDKLQFRANAIYVNSFSDNIPNSGYDESSSVQYGWLWYPRQVEIGDLRQYWVPGQEGVQQRYVEKSWVNNPWFIINENTNSFRNNRIIGNIELNYEFTDQFSMRFKYGGDVLSERRQYRRTPSTKAVLLGSYREDEITFSETNAEILFSYRSNRQNGSDFQYDVRLGGNIMWQRANFLVANNPQLKLFGTDNSIYTLANNRSGVLTESQKTRVGINSVFGTATFSYKNFLYLDATARNDWSSTLVDPEIGNDESSFSFFYPSVSLSAIISEMADLSSTPISFLKLKANYAEVGNGAPPYAFGTTFTPQAAFGGNSVFTANRTVTDPNLTNERTRAFEVGADLRFWNNRLRLDATYYNMLSFDQVIRLPVASTSGYDFSLTNGGSIRNKGIEVLLSGIPVQNEDFTWEATLNLGHNRAVVESLPDIVTSGRYSIVADIFPGDEGGSDLEFVAEEGELFGQLYGLGFVRHPETGEIVHQNGVPMMTQEKVSAGSYQPDLRVGLQNTFSYKNFDFGFLFDGQFGGKIYSRSHALYNTGGTITNNDDPNLPLSTLDGRQSYSVSYDEAGEPVYTLEDAGGGVVGPGLNWEDSNGDGEIDFDTEVSENDVAVQPGGIGYAGYFYQYYGNGFNRDNIEAATYDATYVKLREVSLGYNIPNSFLDKLGIVSARVALVGRNLLLFSDVPTIDPETFSIRNGVFVPGYESQQIFSTRNYGFTINLSF
ncbi:MAG: SusC/RagA family TonB-linked outer membrane protein [Muricauda sp.]|nr:SusC/RagA family TonB-linked outer membrane protein [Allomuricauda sp.]MBA4746022.1 SusC/RagA family TonB-linked outer membrane protein [Allomuricauda sp.]